MHACVYIQNCECVAKQISVCKQKCQYDLPLCTHTQHITLRKSTCNQTAPVLHGGGLPSTIVPQEGGDLILIEINGQPIHCQLLAIAVDLAQVANSHSHFVIARFSLHILIVLWQTQIKSDFYTDKLL